METVRRRFIGLATWVCGLSLAFTVSAHAGSVLVLIDTGDLGAGLSGYETQVQNALSGQSVTFTDFHSYAGSFSAYNAVVLLNYPTADGVQFSSLAESTALANYVQGGGGLVTSEWTNWLIADGNTVNAGLEPALPVVEDATFDHATGLAYQQSTADSVIDNGVASSFSFTDDDAGGTEDQFAPKAGATVFFTSTGGDSANGLIGMQFGTGRSISFSTLIGPNELNNANYATLFGNAVNWAENATTAPVPLPASIYGGLAGIIALAIKRKVAARCG